MAKIKELINSIIREELTDLFDNPDLGKSDKKDKPLSNSNISKSDKSKDLKYSIKVGGENFTMRFDINKNPTKKGVKVQFIPDNKSIALDEKSRNEYINKLQDVVDSRLNKIGLQVDYDQDLPSKETIGFYIKLGDIGDLIVKTLKN